MRARIADNRERIEVRRDLGHLFRELAVGHDLEREGLDSAQVGIGGSLAASHLPHHRAYGSVHGGSMG
jgi:hypothetical protein